jgi:hypothetical protein
MRTETDRNITWYVKIVGEMMVELIIIIFPAIFYDLFVYKTFLIPDHERPCASNPLDGFWWRLYTVRRVIIIPHSTGN